MIVSFAAIITKKGQVFFNPWTDKHEDLIQEFKIQDEHIKILFQPDDNKDLDNEMEYKITTYYFDKMPEWFNSIRDQATTRLRELVHELILKNQNLDTLIGKCAILSNTTVKNAINSNIYIMLGTSIIENLKEGSQVGYMFNNARINNMMNESFVKEMNNGCIINVMKDNSKIRHMNGGSIIEIMQDWSLVESLRGGKIKTMKNNSKILFMGDELMGGGSIIECMTDKSHVEVMRGHNRIWKMEKNSTIDSMTDHGGVNLMTDNSRIGFVYGDCEIVDMRKWSHASASPGTIIEDSRERHYNPNLKDYQEILLDALNKIAYGTDEDPKKIAWAALDHAKRYEDER